MPFLSEKFNAKLVAEDQAEFVQNVCEATKVYDSRALRVLITSATATFGQEAVTDLLDDHVRQQLKPDWLPALAQLLDRRIDQCGTNLANEMLGDLVTAGKKSGVLDDGNNDYAINHETGEPHLWLQSFDQMTELSALVAPYEWSILRARVSLPEPTSEEIAEYELEAER